MKDFFDFLIQLFRIWKGSLFATLARCCITLGALSLSTSPWWDTIAVAIIEYTFKQKIETNLNFIGGLILLILGLVFAIMEYKTITKKAISDDLAKQTEQNAKLAREIQFSTFQTAKEGTCYSILRNLVNKFLNIGVPHLEQKAKEILNSSNNERLIEYIEFILLNPNVEHQHRVWFFNMLGEGQTGKPLLYQFVENYEEVIKKAQDLNCSELVKGSPLNNAYRNITDPSFIQIRKDAYWEAHI